MSGEEGLPEKNRGQSGIYHSTTTGKVKAVKRQHVYKYVSIKGRVHQFHTCQVPGFDKEEECVGLNSLAVSTFIFCFQIFHFESSSVAGVQC